MAERQKIQELVENWANINLLVKLGPRDIHYVESLEQAENGKLVIHAWNRGASPKRSFCLLNIDARIWRVRNL